MKRLVVPLSFALLGLGCRGPRPEAGVVRLADLAPSAESAWPRKRPPAWPKEIEGLRGYRQLRKKKLGRVSMFPEGGGDNRRALVAPADTLHRFRVELPPGAVLRFGFGYVPRPESEGARVRFAVGLTAPGEQLEETLFERSITTRADGGWRDVELDLERWSGQTVQLTLAATGVASEPTVWAAWSAPEIVGRGGAPTGPDVILISLDTLRADRLGCYGYPVDTSPNLDRLAAREFRFARAVSQSPWTYPSHRALFSGLFPTARGLEESPRLAEMLRAAGFRTDALTGGGQMDFRMGFAKGFETFRVFDWIRDLKWLEAWLDRSSGRRRFLFLHTYEIHDPYIHTEFVEGKDGGRIRGGFGKRAWWGLREPVTPEEKEYVSGLYDGGIAYTDRQIGRLLEYLDESGALDRSIVIVTSDHGEQFWEHGTWRHGMNLYDHQILVPLIVHLPDRLEASLGGGPGGEVFEQQVRLVDLYPTILDLLEIPVGHRINGRSLKPLFEGDDLPPIDAFAEKLNLEHRESKALRTERFKFIYSFAKGKGVERGEKERWELYDLTADPAERVNLAERYPRQVAELDARLRALSLLLEDPLALEEPGRELDPDLEERLRALGYLGD